MPRGFPTSAQQRVLESRVDRGLSQQHLDPDSTARARLTRGPHLHQTQSADGGRQDSDRDPGDRSEPGEGEKEPRPVQRMHVGEQHREAPQASAHGRAGNEGHDAPFQEPTPAELRLPAQIGCESHRGHGKAKGQHGVMRPWRRHGYEESVHALFPQQTDVLTPRETQRCADRTSDRPGQWRERQTAITVGRRAWRCNGRRGPVASALPVLYRRGSSEPSIPPSLPSLPMICHGLALCVVLASAPAAARHPASK